METKGKGVFNWFSMNYLKGNPGKTQLLLKDEACIKIDDTDIKSSSCKKLLGVLIDNKITFNKQVIGYMLWLGLQNIWLKTNLEQ